MRIGDRVRRMPTIVEDKNGNRGWNATEPQPGTVTYIHPRGRFYVVQFDMGFSEAFSFREVK